MRLQHDKSWEIFQSIFKQKLTVKEAWTNFIIKHEDYFPKPYWTTIKNIPIEVEQEDINNWIENIIKNNPLPKDVIAFWIGIIKLEENEIIVPAIYLIGTNKYVENDIEWACEPTYIPENRYGLPGLLKEIDSIAQTDEENYEFLDWILPLAYCAFSLDEIIRIKLNRSIFLKFQKKINFAVGHDDGDYTDLSSIEK